jgi:hypothetical protein
MTCYVNVCDFSSSAASLVRALVSALNRGLTYPGAVEARHHCFESRADIPLSPVSLSLLPLHSTLNKFPNPEQSRGLQTSATTLNPRCARHRGALYLPFSLVPYDTPLEALSHPVASPFRLLVQSKLVDPPTSSNNNLC